ncbi:MAG: hypothetical protein AMXMBFR72_12620 [Betaproteobacteria bacterium]|jgi:hypothetical protein|nr:MAG: hypothetical protein BroJett031_32800 [Betaproteobacteria bacterium]
MTKFSSLAPAALTVVLLGCATPGAQNTVPAVPAASTFKAAQVEVVSAQFGVFGADPSGRRILFETNKFPAITAAPYGWYIVFKTDKPTVIWREEFELPEAPPTWGPGEAMGIYTISPDRKTAVTERIIPTRLGFIANEWRYAPGDPIGAHAMRVYIDGQLIREFKFDIEEAPEGQRGGPRSPHAPRRGGSTT